MENLLGGKKVKMDLNGIDGNAYVVMGKFKRAARKQGFSEEQVDKVIEECKSGDYDHLIQTIMAHTE